MKSRNPFIAVIVIIIGTILYFGLKPSCPEPAPRTTPLSVQRIVDGDTLALSDGSKVRLIGIDTPEYHYSRKLLKDSRRSGKDISTIRKMGERAREFTKGLCMGKNVSLEYDVEKHDRYGRVLAYLYLDDGRLVNAEIMKAGYAQTMTIPPNVKYADLFLKLEREARREGRGLWKDDATKKE